MRPTFAASGECIYCRAALLSRCCLTLALRSLCIARSIFESAANVRQMDIFCGMPFSLGDSLVRSCIL
jgi:hypothetical protein